MLEKLEHQLQFTLDCAEAPNVIRIAAQAGLMMVGKYYALTDDNEVYRIAMGKHCLLDPVISITNNEHTMAVMLPHKKMAQFTENEDWLHADIAAVESLARQRFTDTYDKSVPSETTESSAVVLPPGVSIQVPSVCSFCW